MKKSHMVIAGAEQLVLTENAVDQALTETGELLAILTRMRVGNRVSGVVGQPAVTSILNAARYLGEARKEMIEAHGHLDAVKSQLGCRTLMVGTLPDKPLPGDDNSDAGRVIEMPA